MKKNLILILFTIAIASLASGCISVTVDEARIFQPQPVTNKAETPKEMYIEWEEVFSEPSNYTFTNNINNDHSTITITNEDFIPTKIQHGFWADGMIAVTEFTTGDPNRPLVIHCGGNASDRYNSGTFFGLKVIPYADLIIFDYPGYGDSPGTPSAQSFETMVETLANELNKRNAKTNRPLILWGYSLGGFVCAELVDALTKVDAIIIESSANNAKDVAPRLVPTLLRPFVRIQLSPTLASYDNVEALKNYQGKALVLAGTKDGILPAKLSRKLATDLQENGVSVTYHEFAQGNHANLPTLKSYQEVLGAFFSHW